MQQRSRSKENMSNVPQQSPVAGSNDGVAAPNTNPAAAWMNQMSVNHTINPMYMNQQHPLPHQHQMQHPQVAMAEQQLAGLVNSGINPMTMSIQQQQQLQQHQKLQMMQLQQRLKKQHSGGLADQNTSDITGLNYQQTQQLHQHQQHQQPQWNPQQLQQNYHLQLQHEGYRHHQQQQQTQQQMMQFQIQQRE
jgi:hypothetical protein